MSDAVLEVQNLTKYFPLKEGMLAHVAGYVKAVDGVDFEIASGETLALVGESGCGKTTTAFCILQLHTPTSGTIRVEGVDVATLKGHARATFRQSVQAVFQDPYSSLSPRLLVRDIICEPLVVNTGLSRKERIEKAKEALTKVGLPVESLGLYPHEFSGGQRQRIALARALVLDPKLIVLDEPVSALDVSIRASVMNLLKDLQQDTGVAYLLISHDLAGVRYMGHRVGVMYLGKLVEMAPAETLFSDPLHPYTQALLGAALPTHPDDPDNQVPLTGEVPNPINVPSGCRFHTRCPRAMKVCSDVEPQMKEIKPGQFTACHLYV